MGALTREAILAADDLKLQRVDVPEWGAGSYVFVRTLRVREREELEAPMVAARGAVNIAGFRARVVIAACCDEQGHPLFTLEDATAISEKAAGAVERIAEAAMEANGMTDSAAQAAAGNSGGEPAGASFTGSPPPSDAQSTNSVT